MESSFGACLPHLIYMTKTVWKRFPYWYDFKRSHSEFFYKKDSMKHFAKFKRTTCTRVSLLNETTDQKPGTYWKREFSCGFCELFQNFFLIEHLQATAPVISADLQKVFNIVDHEILSVKSKSSRWKVQGSLKEG